MKFLAQAVTEKWFGQKVCHFGSEIPNFDLCDPEKVGQIKNLYESYDMLESLAKSTHHKNVNVVRLIVREKSQKVCFHMLPLIGQTVSHIVIKP